MAQLPALRPRANRLRPLALPGEDAAINAGHWLSAGLLFFFVPTPRGFVDLVRGDTMTFAGTVTPAFTPFGPSWVFGVLAGGTQGYATTAGGDSYYQPPAKNMSLACGAYNPAATGNIGDAMFARWADGGGGFTGNGITVELRDFVGTPRMGSNVIVASSNTQILASGGAGVTMDTARNGMTYCATYDGVTNSAAYSSTGLGFGSGTVARTGTPTGMDRVVLSDPSATLAANRCILWMAGWIYTLPAAQTQYLVGFNGGIPPGLLIQRAPRMFSSGSVVVAHGRPYLIRPAFPA